MNTTAITIQPAARRQTAFAMSAGPSGAAWKFTELEPHSVPGGKDGQAGDHANGDSQQAVGRPRDTD